MSAIANPINVAELEELAKAKLPKPVYDYYASGAHDEVTLRRNRAAYEAIELHYRVLVDVANPDLSTEMLGRPVAMPVAIAPTAFQKMAHPDGELATARAASEAGVLMTLSTLSTTSLEDVAASSLTLQEAGLRNAAPRWFQLYVYRDREATLELVRRAEDNGYDAIVFTVDAPYLGVRERDVRNSFTLPAGLSVANLTKSQMDALPEVERQSGLAAYFADLLEPALGWDTLDWLVESTSLPVVLKGVVRPDDALRAADHGAAAIVVSNHGGRQLDTSPATISVLPRVAQAVGSSLEVYVDGGVRRGSDVVKALALGARGVLVGRPVLWGLAWDGARGVSRVLDMLRHELRLAMALCGAQRINAIGPWLLGQDVET